MSSLLALTFAGFLIAGSAATLLVPSTKVVKSRGVIVAVRDTGLRWRGRHELELDIMVGRPEGGQFAVRETALVPESLVARFAPGADIAMCYLPGDEPSVIIGHRPRRM